MKMIFFSIWAFFNSIIEFYPQRAYTSFLRFILIKDFIVFFFSPRAASVAYGSFQARGPIGATAASLYHGHNNAGYEPHLQPTPQLKATPDP